MWNIQIHPSVESSWKIVSSLHGVSYFVGWTIKHSALMHAPGVSEEGTDGFRSNQGLCFHGSRTVLR